MIQLSLNIFLRSSGPTYDASPPSIPTDLDVEPPSAGKGRSSQV